MSRVRNSAIVGTAAVLAVGGGIWTYYREGISACSDPFYMASVHEQMRAEFLKESEYLAALQAGAIADDVSDSDRKIYSDAAAKLRGLIETADIVGRLKHPNNQNLNNCHLVLSLNDVLSEFDLGQRSTLGFAVDREFAIEARFEIKYEEVPGIELEDRLNKRRNGQILVADVEAGEAVDTARLAKIGRPDYTITEPDFARINYATQFTPGQDIPAGLISRYTPEGNFCDHDLFLQNVKDVMLSNYQDDSDIYSSLSAGAVSPLADNAASSTYTLARQSLDAELESADVLSEVDEVSADKQECIASLTIPASWLESNLSPSGLTDDVVTEPIAIVAEFEVNLEQMPASEFADLLESNKAAVLLEDIQAGAILDTIPVATLSVKNSDVDIFEPEFLGFRYQDAVSFEADISSGDIGQ